MPYSTRTRSVARAFWTRRHWWLVVAVIVPGGLATGWAVYTQAARYEHDRAAARFGRYVADLGSGIERELWSVGEELQQIANLVTLHPDVTLEEFRQYGRSALAVHPAIQACEWVPRVGLEEREEHEARAWGLLDYRILALENGRLVPAGAKREYYPVSYIEPLEPNRAALGFDLSSDSSRREAIIEAAQTGRMVLTRPLTAVQGPAGQQSFLAIVAVYAQRPAPPRAPPASSPTSPREVRGLVLFVIRARGLLGALSPQPTRCAPTSRLALMGMVTMPTTAAPQP